MDGEAKMVKPGYKTTEFWGTTLASIGALLAALAGVLDPKWSAVVMAVSEAAYAISRGMAKK